MLKAKASEFTQTTQTDANGDFHFDAVPLAEYVVTVSISGFATQNQTMTVLSGSAPVLHFELQIVQSKLRVSVLCPAFVKTNIAENANTGEALAPEQEQFREMIRQRVAAGIPAKEVADRVFAAIRDEQFWILTHPDYKAGILTRAESIMAETNPPRPALTAGITE